MSNQANQYVKIKLAENLPEAVRKLIDSQLCRHPWNEVDMLWDWDKLKYPEPLNYADLSETDQEIYRAEVARLLEIDTDDIDTLQAVFFEYNVSEKGVVLIGELEEDEGTDVLDDIFQNSVFEDLPYVGEDCGAVALEIEFPFYGSKEEQLSNLISALILD